MSASSPACQFYGDEKSLFQNTITNTNFSLKHIGIYTSSDIEFEYPSFKKPRISATLPNSGAQMVLYEARIRNFKTQLCRRFRLGICTHGSRCSYAHCIGELRRQEIGGDCGTFQESKLCRMFSQGKQCSYGNTCRFLHIRPEGINSRESSMVEIIPTEPVGHGKSESGQLEFKSVFNESFDAEVNQKRVLLKTKLCNKWAIKRYCPFGNICRFAHGQAELGKPDGYSTSECRVMQTSTAATRNASISVVATGPLLKKKSYALNCKFKRNELNKISRIYADWI